MIEEFLKNSRSKNSKSFKAKKEDLEKKVKNLSFQKDLLGNEKEKIVPILIENSEFILNNNVGITPKNAENMKQKKATIRNIQISNILNKIGKKKSDIEEVDGNYKFLYILNLLHSFFNI